MKGHKQFLATTEKMQQPLNKIMRDDGQQCELVKGQAQHSFDNRNNLLFSCFGSGPPVALSFN